MATQEEKEIVADWIEEAATQAKHRGMEDLWLILSMIALASRRGTEARILATIQQVLAVDEARRP